MNTQEVSLDSMIGQMMIVGFHDKTPSEKVIALIEKRRVGGLLLFSRNIGAPEETNELIHSLQEIAYKAGHPHPLLITIDQENGVVRRLGEGATILPGSMALGAIDDLETTRTVSHITAIELKALGINLNLAPVLDVNNNPLNPVIGARSFGEDVEKVSEHGIAFMNSHQQEGVMTTLKHFPGHGDTHVDSHLALPVIPHDRSRLNQLELVPFRRAIQAGADSVMIAHVFFPALTNRTEIPATISKEVVTGLLREQLDFKGVIMSDCMEMRAIQARWGTSEGSVQAIEAGIDTIMISHEYELQENTIDAIRQAVVEGRISQKRIIESYERITNLKKSYLSWESTLLNANQRIENLSVVGRQKHQSIAKTAYERAVTVVRNRQSLIPFTKKGGKVLVVTPEAKAYTWVEDEKYARYELADAIRSRATDLSVDEMELDDRNHDAAMELAQNYSLVIVGTVHLESSPLQRKWMQNAIDGGIPMIGVGLKGPYDAKELPSLATFVTAYEYNRPALEAIAGVIFGLSRPVGKMPIHLPL